MFNNAIPMFTNRALCADQEYEPDWWHPQEVGGNARRWSHTPDAKTARSICSACPALQECGEYSLKYYNLAGIWGGMDRIERRMRQEALGLSPENWTDTWNSSQSVSQERQEDV